MNLKPHFRYGGNRHTVYKILLLMKLIIVLLITTMMQVSASSFAQKITLNKTKAPLSQIIKAIRSQSGYYFFYKNELLKTSQPVTINVKDASIEEVLELCFKDQPLEFRIEQKTVMIKEKQQTATEKTNTPTLAIDIKGHVVDAQGKPLAGASVKVKGTSKVVITDKNGDFTIPGLHENAVLIISYVGFEPREIDAKQNLSSITLMPSLSKLDEVQVIAYGTTTKRLTTGNSYTVKAEDIEKQPISNPLLALQGRVPGLVITQANGNAGSGVTVRIQGQNSLLAGNDPLYIIDGVQYPSQMLPTTAISTILGTSGPSVQYSPGGQGNPLSFISPADIETIDVLKDADATAIYGSKAANGAIIITTKKGKQGAMTFDFSLQQGMANATRLAEVLNTDQYLQLRRNAFKNDNTVPNVNTDFDLTLWNANSYTNWKQELLSGTANFSDLNASISGGNGNTQLLVSGNYHKETSLFPGDFSDRKGNIHFHVNSSSTNKRFNFQLSGNYLIDNNQLPQTDLTAVSYSLSPNAPAVFNGNGTLNWAQNYLGNGNSSWVNPLSYTLNRYTSKTDNLIANSVLSYDIISGLKFSTSFGFSKLSTNEFLPVTLESIRPERRNGSNSRNASYSSSSIENYIIEPQLNFSKAFRSNKIDILTGGTIQQNENNGEYITAVGFASNGLLSDIRSANSIFINSTASSTYRYNAIFGRVNYTLLDRYILTVSGRRDGSSRFGLESRFHNFGSVGAAWIFTDYKFFKDDLPFISFGKLRSSYGITGNDQIGDYTYMDLYASNSGAVSYQGGNSLQATALPNPYLEWEETKKFSLGMDLGLFNNRILLNATYQQNSSSNQLAGYPLPTITGFTSVNTNLDATIVNRSLEYALNASVVENPRFKWQINGNITFAKNKLKQFAGLSSSTYADSYVIGQPVSIIKAFKFLGVDPALGTYQFLDANGNVTNSPSAQTDRTVLINTLPKFYGGIKNEFGYRSFQLTVFIQFVKQLGVDPLRFGYSVTPGRLGNQPATILNAWANPGDISKIQRVTAGSAITSQVFSARSSDAAYVDASFLRLKNVSISYQLPENLRKTLALKQLKFFLQGENLATISPYKGLDPETQSPSLPPLRMITLGAKLSL